MIDPVGDLKQIVQLTNIEYGHDLKFIAKTYNGMAGKALSEVFADVLEPS